MNINEISENIVNWRKEKGFYTPESLQEGEMLLGKLMLVVTEISEAAEAVRKGDENNFREELADVFIRLLDITGTMGIDIENEIIEKMKINKNRPYLHNKKTKL